MSKLIKSNLFSLPIHQIKIDPNLYDKEKILSDIEYNKSLQNSRNATHQKIGRYTSDIHHSYKDFDNEDFRIINYEKLIEVYQKVFTDFFDNQLTTVQHFEWKFYIVNYSAMTEGQWLPSHGHLGSDNSYSGQMTTAFACIHYLNFKKEHSPTTFENPANFAEFTQITQPELLGILNANDSENSYLHETWEVSAEEDSMIIFPAALKHEVKVQRPTKESRITISTNIEIRRKTSDFNY